MKEANKTKSTPPHRPSSLQSQPQTSHLSPVSAIQRPASSSSSSTSSTPQLLFQPDSFTHLSQHSPSLSQLQALADSQALGPVVNMSQDFLQSHRMGLLTGAPSITAGGAFPSYPGLTSGIQPGALPLQSPISVQMALTGEPRHCLSMAYSGGYLGAHHTFTAGCFDRWRQETERESTAMLPSHLPTPKHPFTDLLSLSVGTATSLATPASPPLSHRRLKRKQRAKGKTDPVEVITLTWRKLLCLELNPEALQKSLCHNLNWLYKCMLLWDCHHCEWDESSSVIKHPPHSVPVLSCVCDSWANFRSAQNTTYLW